MHQIRVEHRGEQEPISGQNTCTLRERLLEATGGQFIEEHVGHHEVEATIGEGKRILHIQGEILRAIDVEGGLSNAEKCLGLVRDDQATRELSREAPQQEGCEVTVACAELKDCLSCDAADLREDEIVEDIALERATVIAGEPVPLLRDAIVVGGPGYGACPFSLTIPPRRGGRKCR